MIVLPSPHALTLIPSPVDAGEVALIPIPSPGGRRGRAVARLRAHSFTLGEGRGDGFLYPNEGCYGEIYLPLVSSTNTANGSW